MNYKDTNDYEMLYLIEDRNEEAYYYIYDKYAPLINKIAAFFYRKFRHIGIEYDDLYQEGMYGLGQAISEYKSTETALFYTMAFVCIKREMQRLIVRANRNKNLFNSNTLSLSETVYDDLTLEGTMCNISDMVDYKYSNDIYEKSIVDIKYNLQGTHGLVFELKFNGFSNIEISLLLDLPYKKVDNSLRYIKNYLNKNIIE